MKIVIGKPYKSEQGEHSVLSADIQAGQKSFTLWYQVDKSYGMYLCDKRADPFLLVLLPYSMMLSTKQEPVTLISEAPVSERLHHQLTQYYIPILCKNISYYSPIIVEAQTISDFAPAGNGVGTGISGGVDSSYTVAKYLHCEDEGYRLTHGVYHNMGLYGGRNSETEHALQERVQRIANEAGVTLIIMESNTCETLYQKAYAPIVPATFMAAALALSGLFSVYYYSSGYTANDFAFAEADAAYYDLLNVTCFSTESTAFYSSGAEARRMEKIQAITEAPFTYDNLTVCLSNSKSMNNCGRCAKCTRTMAELDTLGKLDLYANAFDVPAFRADPGYHWGYVLLKGRSDAFCKEILNMRRAQGKKLPICVYWSCLKKWVARGFTTKNRKRERVELLVQSQR